MFHAIRRILRQFLLRRKFSKDNKIQKGVIFSRDLKIGKGCSIGRNSIIGQQVILGNNVRIGRGAFLERVSIRENSFIESGVICTGYGNGKILIGKESYIGIRDILDWSDNITIGNYVHIAGPSTGLWTHTSAQMCINSIPLSREDDKNYRPTAPIVIEDNVYIGGNCSIYPGITIHHHSIVAPNSAVTKDVPPYTMVGGVTAREIKKINK